VTNNVLLPLLQHITTLVFANKAAIGKDILLTTASGAALSVHVVDEIWNASDIDVIVGNSAATACADQYFSSHQNGGEQSSSALAS
jgi:hypothetical protein